mgnify:CR=1 FL=1
MAEFTNVALQTVAVGQNVLFNETPICGGANVYHREGSGIVRIRNITQQCLAKYKISFGGNIQIPTGGTVESISLAIALDGEALGSATMIVTPAAVEDSWNVFKEIYVKIPRGICPTIAVENTSTQPIEVQNANLTVERVA